MLAGLSACATSHDLRNPRNTQASLAVAYVDTSKASLQLTHAQAKRLRPSPVLWYQFGLNPDGILYHSELDPGRYVLTGLGGVADGISMTHKLPEQGRNRLAVTIGTRQVVFLGSYRLTRIKPRDFSQVRYELRLLSRPTEKEVLTSMMKYAKGTVWEQRLARRIGQLHKH